MTPGIVTTAEQRVRELRHEGVRDTVALLAAGKSASAYVRMMLSVELQARVAGIKLP